MVGSVVPAAGHVNAPCFTRKAIAFGRLYIADPPKGITWAKPTDQSDIKQATYVSGTETKVLKFAYEIQAGDWDGDRLVVPLLERTSLGEGTVKWAFGDRYADHSGTDAYFAHQVDGG